MNYLVFYTKGCSPYIKTFTSKKKAETFANIIELTSKGNRDNWVDFIIKGDVVKEYSGSESIIKEYHGK